MGIDVVMIIKLTVATVLGAVVGFEREYVGKAAGMRTFSLVSLGSCLFTILSAWGFQQFVGTPGFSFDPSRIAAQVITGIGFLGAGLIIFRGFRVEGLTTAAGLWVSAAIGMAVGLGFYVLSLVTAVLVLVIFFFLKHLEPKEHVGGPHRDDVI